MVKPILIAGPTASGKTALALALAEAFDGVIINTDSAQVYRELRIISARPSDEELDLAPHYLFGHVSGGEAYSTGAWLKDVKALLPGLLQEKRRVIFVGGTGLYFQALLQGLSEVPAVDEAIRHYWRNEAASCGALALHNILRERDPVMAERLEPGDTQRVIRALEVMEGTGRSLSYWQEQKTEGLLSEEECHRFVVSWPREQLYERINERFKIMIESGGIEEVRQLKADGFDEPEKRGLPMLRALGVPDLMAYIEGEMSLEAAIERASMQTRRYAKRQLTWLRGNMISWKCLDAQEMESLLPIIVSKIHQSG